MGAKLTVTRVLKLAQILLRPHYIIVPKPCQGLTIYVFLKKTCKLDLILYTNDVVMYLRFW